MREKDVETLQLKTRLEQQLQDLNKAHDEISKLRHTVDALGNELNQKNERQKFSFAPTPYNPALFGRATATNTSVPTQFKSTSVLPSSNLTTSSVVQLNYPSSPTKPSSIPIQDKSSIVFSTANINPSKFQS